MHLIITFFKHYPSQSIVTLLAMLFAGLAEGFGLSMLLPLLSLVLKSPNGSDVAAPQTNSALENLVTGLFDTLGIPQTIGVLLTIFVFSILLKSYPRATGQ